MSELKLCKDCKHYRPAQSCYMAGIPDACMHPDMLELDPVHGRQVFKAGYSSSRPHYQRKQGACGMDAKRFEQAPPPEPEPPEVIEYEPKGIMKRTEGRPYPLYERIWDRLFG